MASKFDFIKDVKDADFNTRLSELYRNCLRIEYFEEESPADCIINIRRESERLIKYLYRRLVGYEGATPTTYEILRNDAFKVAVHNDTLITLADRLRFDGNQIVYTDDDKSITIDEEMSAKSSIQDFIIVAQEICRKIDTLPPVLNSEGNENLKKSPYIKGQVLLKLVFEPTSLRGTNRYLQASVKNCNVSRASVLCYKWYKAGDNTPQEQGPNNKFPLPPNFSEEIYSCVVTSSETSGKLRSRFYHDSAPENNSDTMTDINVSTEMSEGQAIQETWDEPVYIEQENTESEANSYSEAKALQSIIPQAPPIAEKSGTTGGKSAKTPVRNNDHETAEQPPDAKCQATPRPPTTPLPLAITVVCPLSLPDMPKLFDPISGLVHYFIRPNDEFALNSLELLGADVCLYRLLKREGFERIVFWEIDNEYCFVDNNDAYSRNILNARELRQRFFWEICAALESNIHKTAIVMPLSVLEKDSRYRSELIRAINRIDKAGSGRNILLLTATHRGDIVRCFAEPSGLHPWLSAALSGKTDNEKIAEAVRELEERGMIVLADEYHADEIANLLLRKKLFGGSGSLKDISASKVYELASLLLEHCLQTKKHFRQIPYKNRRDSCIRQLNALMDDAYVQEELVTVAGKLKPSVIGYSDSLDSLFLERLYHIDVNR